MNKKIIPGLILVIIISMISIVINDWLPIKLESLTIAIIIGILVNNLFILDDKFKSGIKFSLKKILKLGIILLGFKLNSSEIINAGPRILILVLIVVPLTLLTYIILSKKFGVNKHLGALLGVGSCICGASAIVAMTPVINAEEEDSVIAVSVVSFLGAIGVIIYTLISKFNIISIENYGIWSGLSLQGVAHAVAAAFAMGDVSGKIGTLVKMTRVVMLVPVTLFLGMYFNKSSNSTKSKFPMYVLYFIIAAFINSLGIIPSEVVFYLKKASSFFILIAMAGMGLSVNFKDFANKGVKALLMGSVLFTAFSIFNYFLVILL